MKGMMKWRIVCMLVMFLVFFISVPARAAGFSVSVSGTVNSAESSRFLKKLNDLRRKKGLSSVQMDQSLQRAAEIRAAELTIRYSHERPSGGMPGTLSKKIGAENIAVGYNSAGAVFTGWVNSPAHYQNMTRANMKSAGICCLEYRGRMYWVNLFGTDYAEIVKPAGRKTKTFKVSIAEKYLSSSRITLGNAGTMNSKEKKTLKISIRCAGNEPTGVLPNSFFTFKSSNPKILKVNRKGVVTSLREGKARITVQAKKYKKLKKTFWLAVKDDSRVSYVDYSDD
ncbi:CAP domain-containing protein [Lachnospiraceae bacterium 46-15]